MKLGILTSEWKYDHLTDNITCIATSIVHGYEDLHVVSTLGHYTREHIPNLKKKERRRIRRSLLNIFRDRRNDKEKELKTILRRNEE